MTPDESLPVVLDPRVPNERETMKNLMRRKDIAVIDEMDSFLEEIYAIRHPECVRTGIPPEDLEKYLATLAGVGEERKEFGVWVWYPWKSLLIHVLPEPLHTELRTSRNRNLITASEQQRYYESYIGVMGLSVGNAVVASLVHTGGAKHLRIADHDRLSGSNLNRIRTGLDSVGLPKCTIALREIYLVNPFADVTVYGEGIRGDNLDRFLTVPKHLDVVIDEMDSLYLKIRLRLRARELGIPVIMAADNGDGIVVDIERYDLDTSLPIMHGQVPEAELLRITPDISRPEAARIITSWVKPENVSGRMKDSLLELGKSLYTWPQLGNAAFMAGSVLSYIVRKIVNGEPVNSGKTVINPDAFFVPGYDSEAMRTKREEETVKFAKAIGLTD